MGHPRIFIIRDEQSSRVILNIHNLLLNLLPGLGCKDGRRCPFPSFAEPSPAGGSVRALGWLLRGRFPQLLPLPLSRASQAFQSRRSRQTLQFALIFLSQYVGLCPCNSPKASWGGDAGLDRFGGHLTSKAWMRLPRSHSDDVIVLFLEGLARSLIPHPRGAGRPQLHSHGLCQETYKPHRDCLGATHATHHYKSGFIPTSSSHRTTVPPILEIPNPLDNISRRASDQTSA